MRIDELKNAFGEPPIEFDASLNRALANIPDERPAHRRYKIAPLIAAIVCALALGGAALAVANNWDIFDMMGRSRSASDDSDTLRALSQSPDMMVAGQMGDVYAFRSGVRRPLAQRDDKCAPARPGQSAAHERLLHGCR